MNQFTFLKMRRTMAKIMSVTMALSIISGTTRVLGETNETIVNTDVQTYEQRGDQILEKVDEYCSDLKDTIGYDMLESEEERKRADQFLSYVQEYITQLENGEIELKENANFEEELTEYIASISSGEDGERMVDLSCYSQPIITTFRTGYAVHMIFLNLNGNGENVQIWGKNSSNHFLIKDYGSVLPCGLFVKYYRWDITEWGNPAKMGKENITERNKIGNNLDHPTNKAHEGSDQRQGVIKEYDLDLDNIGVYIRVKSNLNNLIGSYYKNFSLINRNQFKEINMITSYDDPYLRYNKKWDLFNQFNRQRNTNYNSQFPAIAFKNVKFRMKLFKDFEDVCKKYTIKIKGGDNYYKEVDINNKSELKLTDAYEWTPRYNGVFNIVVYDGEEPIIVRKVFVRNKTDEGNENLLNIEEMDVGINSASDSVEINVKVKNYRESNDTKKNTAQIALRVGEESVWSEMIKNYDEGDNSSEAGSQNGRFKNIVLSENENDFRFSSGEYFVDALVKKKKSIEYEDVARRIFSREKYDGLFRVVSIDNKNSFDIGDLPRIGEEYEFEIVLNEEHEEYENMKYEDYDYSFLIWDSRGKRLISDYSSNRRFKYTFRDPGDYRIYLRAKLKDDAKMNKNINGYKDDKGNLVLRNSFIDEVSCEVDIPMANEQDIQLLRVFVSNFRATDDGRFVMSEKYGEKGNLGTADFTSQDGSKEKLVEADYVNNLKLVSHSKNVINIMAKYDNSELDVKGVRAGRLMYKVYAIHDGIWECLTPYTFENTIPFYPRSEGDYKLLILVKDSISGAEQDRGIIELKADNLLNN